MKFAFALLGCCLIVLVTSLPSALCWSNGGYSADPSHPDYGTHDWIAQHALDLLPENEKQYLTDNLGVYLYGTELPDNGQATDGIGDTTKHHFYYSSAGSVTDDVAADRAQTMYNTALADLKAGKNADAAKTAGTMTHYIADVAVFGHVMGKSTAWGEEEHHSDYETHVNDNTATYESRYNSYFVYDGSLSSISAYNATLLVANNTVFGGASGKGCVWMDSNYGWSNTAFSSRSDESLNYAVNAVADVLHTLYLEANPASTKTPTSSPQTPSPSVPEYPRVGIVTILLLTVLALTIIQKVAQKKATSKVV